MNRVSHCQSREGEFMTKLNVTLIPCYKDNYSYIIQSNRTCLIIDACETKPLLDFFEAQQLTPTAILTTHHHWDHVGGNIDLQQKFKIPIYGNKYDKDRIPGLTHEIDIQREEKILIDSIPIHILFAPGHTTQHLLYHFKVANLLFTGDAFFSCGCGRLFEGTYHQLYESVQKIAQLPTNTQIYFGHEYSLKNAEFALSLEPGNLDLKNRRDELLSKSNTPSSPTTLDLELKINPFLRAKYLAKSVENANRQQPQGEFETFVAIRKLRDTF